MEERLLAAVNKTGFGPMGTGGDTTALAVNVEYSSGHGFTPVAVCFNCWINRRASARIYNDGRIERVRVSTTASRTRGPTLDSSADSTEARRVRALNAGDFVDADGEIVLTAGLPTHQRILDYMRNDKPLPIDITGGTLFHLGSYSRDTDGRFEVLYINPTTSTRFNAVMPPIDPPFRPAHGRRQGRPRRGLRRGDAGGRLRLSVVSRRRLARLLSDAIKDVIAVAWDDLVVALPAGEAARRGARAAGGRRSTQRATACSRR